MRSREPHRESHRNNRSGWLRAAVLGSNDAIVSTSSLMIGVAASAAERATIVVAGVSALVAGAMSMAVGEYVSVSSQRDAERADIAKETRELAEQPQAELEELVAIYMARGLDAPPAVYGPLHPGARLTSEEKRFLADGLTATLGSRSGESHGH